MNIKNKKYFLHWYGSLKSQNHPYVDSIESVVQVWNHYVGLNLIGFTGDELITYKEVEKLINKLSLLV